MIICSKDFKTLLSEGFLLVNNIQELSMESKMLLDQQQL